MQIFKTLYDNAPVFSLKDKNLSERYATLGLDGRFHMSTSEIDEKLQELIVTPILCGKDYPNRITRKDLNMVYDAFYYSKQLFGDSAAELYYHALRTLFQFLNSDQREFVPFTDKSRWETALSYLKCYTELHIPNDYSLSVGMEKQSEIAKSVRRLRKKGAKASIHNNELTLTQLDNCYRKLDSMVERIGGRRFIESLLALLDVNTKTGRIMFTKNSKTGIPVDVDVPFAYLINLGLRKTSYKGSESSSGKYLYMAVQLATDICTAEYPVQTYTVWEDMFHRDIDTIEYFRKWAVLDSIYNVQQSGPDFAIDMISFLIDDLDAKGKKLSDDFSMQEYKSVMTGLTALSKPKEFVQLKKEKLSIIGNQNAQFSIFKFAAAQTVNPVYLHPLDYDKVTYGDKPFIVLPNGDLFLYPSSLGVMGWYEVMMTEFRKQDEEKEAELITQGKKPKVNKIDSIVGFILEDYVRMKMDSRGICSVCGKYKVDSIVGECDIVNIGASTMLFAEMKKKTLTRMARQGYVYKILLDFAGSLLNSQEQAFRTEALLKRHGVIELSEDSKVTPMTFGGQSIEKVTLTLNDYGPLHEQVVVKELLREFLKHQFSVVETEIAQFEKDPDATQRVMDGYKKLNSKVLEFNIFLKELELKQPKTMGAKNLLDDCWFFNIEQYCYLISISKDTEDFIDNVIAHKHIVNYTQDFWAEIDNVIQQYKKRKPLLNGQKQPITLITPI